MVNNKDSWEWSVDAATMKPDLFCLSPESVHTEGGKHLHSHLPPTLLGGNCWADLVQP